jgi:hypothetical protein
MLFVLNLRNRTMCIAPPNMTSHRTGPHPLYATTL